MTDQLGLPIDDPKTRAEQLREEFESFHAEHPEVWDLFVRFTFIAIRRGHDHFGAGAIWERIRWETAVGDAYSDQTFRLNNNHRAFYARKFEREFPAHSGFFRTRAQRSAEMDATAMPPLGPRDFKEQAA